MTNRILTLPVTLNPVETRTEITRDLMREEIT